MVKFDAKPLNESALSRAINRNPLIFGIPFILIMVGASYGLSSFTQVRYDLHDQKVKRMSKEDALGLKQDRKKFDIREQYYRLSAAEDETWENKRIARPKGLPEWGVPPPEPTPPKSDNNAS